jgi:very-long-chain (3R)-3-hydroxyacyl-CoA dehydratase
VLYPLGIGSETWLVYRAIPHAAAVNPLLGYVLWAVLAIYVPGKHCSSLSVSLPLGLTRAGSYILYTHMMAQRRRVMRGKEKARE